MVVDDLHAVCIAIPPFEAHPPLVVDADAVEAGAIASKLFQPVTRRDP
jgi:hypothetical protein